MSRRWCEWKRACCAACAALILNAALAQGADERYQEETGRLEEGGGRLSSGEYFHDLTVTADQGNVVIVELHSTEFDAFLQMVPQDKEGPHGERIWHNNDMRRGSNDACLAVELPADGAYDILVTSAQPNEQGAYKLAMTILPSPIRTETGELADGDRALPSGELCDYYEFAAKAGDLWVIDVAGEDFNTYVFGRSADDQEYRIDNDDAFNDPQHSQVAMVIPRDGQYYVGVTSAQPGETGAYRLTLSTTLALETAAQPAPAGDVQRGARELGLPQQRATSTIWTPRGATEPSFGS